VIRVFTSRHCLAAGFILSCLFVGGCGRSTDTPAATGRDQAAGQGNRAIKDEFVEPEFVVGGLVNPSGIAIQPGSNHIFVASKNGVARIVPGEHVVLHEEIVGFPTDTYGKGPAYELGPLGLAFLDDTTLVVGDGSLPDGEELVRIYDVSAEPLPVDQVKKADDMLASAGPITPDPDVSVNGEGNFYGVAVLGNDIFVTGNGDDTKGWVSRVRYEKDSKLELEPFIATKVATETDAPAGSTTRDGQLVVSQLGEVTTNNADSLLTFYDPASGNLLKNLTAGLKDVCGIAYSPKTDKLYAVDFSWSDASAGGLFRLDIEEDTVQVTRIAKLDRPTALAFAPDGTLYVTLIGTAHQDGKPGQVITFKGL
jgi:glucose/arabinose dehydrogenase